MLTVTHSAHSHKLSGFADRVEGRLAPHGRTWSAQQDDGDFVEKNNLVVMPMVIVTIRRQRKY